MGAMGPGTVRTTTEIQQILLNLSAALNGRREQKPQTGVGNLTRETVTANGDTDTKQRARRHGTREGPKRNGATGAEVKVIKRVSWVDLSIDQTDQDGSINQIDHHNRIRKMIILQGELIYISPSS